MRGLHVPTLDYSHQRNHPAICYPGPMPIVCSETDKHHAPAAEQYMTSDDGRGEHQMVLIIRKSGHIRGVTLCHGDVTTLSCGH